MFGNKGNSIDDNLHQELNLENPEEEDEEEYRNTIVRSLEHAR
jgi:hypothetical protein